MNIINVDKYNIDLIDLISLISECEIFILRDLDKFGLVDSTGANFKKRDVKIVFYFYILKHVCDYIIDTKSKNKCVFFYNKKCLNESELAIFDRCDTSKWRFGQFLLTLINKLNNILPTLFYLSDDLCFGEIDINTGECEDLASSIKSKLVTKSNKLFTFEKSKKFVKQFDLTYLDEQYFNQVKIKSLVYK